MKLVLVGASGNIGRSILEIFDDNSVVTLASPASSGKNIAVAGKIYQLQNLADYNFSANEVVMFATENDVSRVYVPKALAAGAYVVDSSSQYRGDENVPLIVFPVNGNQINQQNKQYSLANCLSAPISIAINALHKKFTAKKIVASTYQSVSGAGKKAMDELVQQTSEYLDSKPISTNVFAKQIAFNLIPAVGSIESNNQCSEEIKIQNEVQKILQTKLDIFVTTVRVPVLRGHSISITVEFDKPLNNCLDILKQTPFVQFDSEYKTPIEMVQSDLVSVSRVRQHNAHTVSFWIVSDNLRRGGALDLVETAKGILNL